MVRAAGSSLIGRRLVRIPRPPSLDYSPCVTARPRLRGSQLHYAIPARRSPLTHEGKHRKWHKATSNRKPEVNRYQVEPEAGSHGRSTKWVVTTSNRKPEVPTGSTKWVVTTSDRKPEVTTGGANWLVTQHRKSRPAEVERRARLHAYHLYCGGATTARRGWRPPLALINTVVRNSGVPA